MSAISLAEQQLVPTTSICPEDLLSKFSGDASRRKWFVVRTLVRQEKSLARELKALGIPYYLPLMVRRLTYRRRTAWSYTPIFSGVVFVFADDDECRLCQNSKRVASTVPVCDGEGMHSLLTKVSEILADEQKPGQCRSRMLKEANNAIDTIRMAVRRELVNGNSVLLKYLG